jgi:hypothetical protein
MMKNIALLFAALFAVATPANLGAQPEDGNATSAPQSGRPVVNTVNKAGEIATQPVRDVGAKKREIPVVLERAAEDPYATTGVKTCRQIASAMTELNEVLGPDYEAGHTIKENRAGKLAEAGGKTVVNTLIPFRGLVREVSGAAPAERRYNAALDAGLVRRGFLRGLATAKGCKVSSGASGVR